MGDAVIRSYGSTITLTSHDDLSPVLSGLEGLFARRYIPKFEVVRDVPREHADAVMVWEMSKEGFVIKEINLGIQDRYVIKSAPPQPYVNEAPYFFILQALARTYVKQGLLMFTDTVSFYDKDSGEAYLLLGYPHTGKSTMLAMALTSGYIPLTTENTLIELKDGEAYVVGGTDVLVFDPKIKEIYGVDVKTDSRTKHGYGIVDLAKLRRPEKAPVVSIHVLYCSFTSTGANMKKIKGRKALKILWHFATAVIRGLDYYDPYPPNLSDPELDAAITGKLTKIVKNYEGRFHEAFGSHKEVFERIISSK